MGWAHGHGEGGRDIGYGVAAECDVDGCDKQIDRGVSFACGYEHDSSEHSCAGYFCEDHIGRRNHDCPTNQQENDDH